MSLLFLILVLFSLGLQCASQDEHNYAIKTNLPYIELLELVEREGGTILKEVKHLKFFHARFDQPVGSKQIWTWDFWPLSLLMKPQRRIHEHPDVELHYQHPLHINKRNADPYNSKPVFDMKEAKQYPHPKLVKELQHENDKNYIPVYRKLKHDIDELFPINDPADPYTWQYLNDGLRGSPVTGFDMNIKPAYIKGYSGLHVKVVVLDDALDTEHADLKENYDKSISANVVETDIPDNPRGPKHIMPFDDQHGTECAGLIAASMNNNICSHGVAYRSSIGAVRLLSGKITDVTEADSLSHRYDEVDIYCASWGPTDDGMTFDLPRALAGAALEHGAVYGRRGLGSIYVFASGNGGFFGDNCGADGFISSPYVIAVAALDNAGEKTIYSESCAATRFSMPVGSPNIVGLTKGDMLTSTIGNNRCMLSFVGTSAAAPLGAGCLALALGARPSMSAHDLEWLLPFSGRIPYPNDKGWQVNGAGILYNSHAGYGLLDCSRLVEMAIAWQPVEPLCIVKAEWGEQQPLGWEALQDVTPFRGLFRYIDNQMEAETFITEVESLYYTSKDSVYITNKPAELKFTVPGPATGHWQSQTSVQCEVDVVEKVVVTYQWKHICRGAMQIWLRSPSNTKIVLLDYRYNDTYAGNGHMVATSVATWGERIEGEWILEVISDAKCANPIVDAMNTTTRGILKFVKMEFWGTKREESGFERNEALITPRMVNLAKVAREKFQGHMLSPDEIRNTYDEQRWMALNDSIQIIEQAKHRTSTPTPVSTTKSSVGNYGSGS